MRIPPGFWLLSVAAHALLIALLGVWSPSPEKTLPEVSAERVRLRLVSTGGKTPSPGSRSGGGAAAVEPRSLQALRELPAGMARAWRLPPPAVPVSEPRPVSGSSAQTAPSPPVERPRRLPNAQPPSPMPKPKQAPTRVPEPPRRKSPLLPSPVPEPSRDAAVAAKGPSAFPSPAVSPRASRTPDTGAVSRSSDRSLPGTTAGGAPPAGAAEGKGPAAVGPGGEEGEIATVRGRLPLVDVATLRVTRRVPPEYPGASRRRGEQGVVVLVLTVVGGAVRDVVVERSSGFDALDGAAVKALRRWRFEGTEEVRVRVPVAFRLEDS